VSRAASSTIWEDPRARGQPSPTTASAAEQSNVVKELKSRWFLMRDAHAKEGTVLLQPRCWRGHSRG
jgi:hypothetical protein